MKQQIRNHNISEPLVGVVPNDVINQSATQTENGMEVPHNHSNTRCGIIGFYPECLQRFSSINTFFVLLLFSGMAFAYGISVSHVSITSLQIRYGLSSSFIGIYNLLNMTVLTLSVIVVTLLGGRPNSHKPRWVAGGMFLCAIGFFMKSVTQFSSPLYDYQQNLRVERGDPSSHELCSDSDLNNSYNFLDYERCSDTDSSRSIIPIGSEMVILLLIGNALIGCGNIPIFILGIAHIDDNVSKEKSPLYMGIFFATFGMGSVVGMPIASYFTNIYVDFYRVDGVDIDPSDPRWVGAWWLGYIIIFLTTLVISCLLFLVPKQPPETQHSIAIHIAVAFFAIS
uniref:Solute carrier organic anion transporter family member 1B3-like n=1 Tax=Saccoglossus kowalevskii TaxID=10224 RepID=A0ABM0M867_SACKO|nr:PREDICTED: solute carrier organic anion transporter family member 1B3-like [Saccoglossus kowalevskii]